MRTYSSIKTEFRRVFGEASNFSWCDFRQTFDGNLINASLVILPLESVEETRNQALDEFRRIYAWFRVWVDYFDEGDAIQVTIGFSKESNPPRRIFKGSIKVKDLPRLPENFDPETLVRSGGCFQPLFNWDAFTGTK